MFCLNKLDFNGKPFEKELYGKSGQSHSSLKIDFMVKPKANKTKLDKFYNETKFLKPIFIYNN